MNLHDSCPNVVFKNPENKPLEELNLEIQTDGIKENIPALDERWVEKKSFLYYEAPKFFDSSGKSIIGAKESWMELMYYILEDLNWLLRLPFFKFWSNIVYNIDIIDSVLSFLVDAPTFYSYEDFPNDPDVKNIFNMVRHKILIFYARIVTSKESSTEYMNNKFHGNLIYDKYIFTVPLAMDLCQQYGRENKKIVEKIIHSAFTLQSSYMNEDMDKVIYFIASQSLRNIEQKFEDCPVDLAGKAIPLSERGGARMNISLDDLEDQIIFLLDIVTTISIFISIYPVVKSKFMIEIFINRIVSIYANTIPEMYKKLDSLALKDETVHIYVKLKHRLDVIRIEILHLFRSITYMKIELACESKDEYSAAELLEMSEEFLNFISNTLSETSFVIDYNKLYPFMNDTETLMKIYPQVDTIKFQYILNSIYNTISEVPNAVAPLIYQKLPECSAGPSNSQQRNTSENNMNVSEASSNIPKSETDLIELISEVKDIFDDLGDGFIEKCLKHYNYNRELVLNAILEDSLPLELKKLDKTLPYIPPDTDEPSAVADAAIGMQRLNVFDNDEFDVMTKDVIDTTRVHKGKRKDKHRNLNDLLNDKSYREETRDIYNKYSIITSEYDDEYDDTYDDQDIGPSNQDDAIEMDARPFIVPRVLQKHQRMNETDYQEEEEEEIQSGANKNDFCENPELIRARAEERRGTKIYSNSRFNSKSKDVVGEPKGQGQSKEVVVNRNFKNKNKASKANHNRRTGSQWKRNQGMVPS